MGNTTQVEPCFNRRQWLGVAAGAGALTVSCAWAGEKGTKAKASAPPALVRELSPEEKEAAKGSRLVAEALQLRRGGGYSCAECILEAAVKCYDLPAQTTATAAAFGGGVGHGELCGFLTGGSMALGALATKGEGGRAKAKKRLKKWNDAWWAWWKGMAPLDCRDLKPHYDKAGFENMLTRACLQWEKIVAQG